MRSYLHSCSRIAGVTTVVPSLVISNDSFLNRFAEKEIASISKLSGVKTRYHVDKNQSSFDLCAVAASNVLDRLGWDPLSLDGLIFLSQTPSYKLPSTACVLQSCLGLSTSSFAFDVNLGCSAYPYGLWLASSILNAGGKRVLVLAGETTSTIVDPSDRSTALLFGDAGSATALESTDTNTTSHYTLGTDGSCHDTIIANLDSFQNTRPEFVAMDGSKVFEFTLQLVPDLIRYAQSDPAMVPDFYCLHQANKFMLDTIRKKAGVPAESFPVNIDKFGNTSSASIPLLLTCEINNQLSQRDSIIASIGFGVGLSWSVAVNTLDSSIQLNHIYLT